MELQEQTNIWQNFKTHPFIFSCIYACTLTIYVYIMELFQKEHIFIPNVVIFNIKGNHVLHL